jgi:hypothetical protein
MADERTSDESREPELSAGMREALRAHSGSPPPMREADWSALHGRIMARARPWLAERERGRWWLYASRWATAGVPIGLAAGILLAVALGVAVWGANGAADDTTGASADEPLAIEEVIARSAGDALPADATLGGEQDALLTAMYAASPGDR